jgi:hypothetical protein
MISHEIQNFLWYIPPRRFIFDFFNNINEVSSGSVDAKALDG